MRKKIQVRGRILGEKASKLSGEEAYCASESLIPNPSKYNARIQLAGGRAIDGQLTKRYCRKRTSRRGNLGGERKKKAIL